MHFDDGKLPVAYMQAARNKVLLILFTLLVLIIAFVVAIAVGAVAIPMREVLLTFIGVSESPRYTTIIQNIRLPQALTSIVAGAALAVAGAAMQSVLRNPLGSPFTLGISHAAAFGAAFAVMFLGSGTLHASQIGAITITNQSATTLSAFLFSLLATTAILVVSRSQRSRPETLILVGVALGALFSAGTMFLQYFADDVQLAAMVFWTFGDTARASWGDFALISSVTLVVFAVFWYHSWNFNIVEVGDETARGLGVRVVYVRILGMILATLLTAVVTALLGIIGFVGLIVPHLFRRFLGADHRYLLPASCVGGGALLLISDTVARLVIAPSVLPVSVLTAFVGAPLFLLLVIKEVRR